jgi:hypothetical protein
MSVAQVSCRFGDDAARLRIRELTGLDEQCIRDVSTRTAIALLNRVVEPRPEASWQAARLTAADRDRLLAAIYRVTYGERVASTPQCQKCQSLFDLTFTIDDLQAAVDRVPPAVAESLPDGTFRTAGGAHFRLPTGEDELAVAGLPPAEAEQALLERCLLDAQDGADARAAVENALEALAPVLDLDIHTTCPECGVQQAVHFDVQFYLLRAIAQERPLIAREIHCIATAYGWSLQEILGLARSERRQFVELIESEQRTRRRTP